MKRVKRKAEVALSNGVVLRETGGRLHILTPWGDIGDLSAEDVAAVQSADLVEDVTEPWKLTQIIVMTAMGSGGPNSGRSLLAS